MESKWVEVTKDAPITGESNSAESSGSNQQKLSDWIVDAKSPENTNPEPNSDTNWGTVTEGAPVAGGGSDTPPEPIEPDPDTAQVSAQNMNSQWLPFSYLDNIQDEKDPEDYRNLNHKPMINGVTLNGNQTTESLGIKKQIEIAIASAIEILELDTPKIYYHLRSDWDAMTTLISKKNTIYVYVDYAKTVDGKDVAGIKLGDGNSYLIDLPFVDEVYAEHIANQEIHVSPDDRLNWDAKVRCVYDDGVDESNLIFTTARLSEI